MQKRSKLWPFSPSLWLSQSHRNQIGLKRLWLRNWLGRSRRAWFWLSESFFFSFCQTFCFVKSVGEGLFIVSDCYCLSAFFHLLSLVVSLFVSVSALLLFSVLELHILQTSFVSDFDPQFISGYIIWMMTFDLGAFWHLQLVIIRMFCISLPPTIWLYLNMHIPDLCWLETMAPAWSDQRQVSVKINAQRFLIFHCFANLSPIYQFHFAGTWH